MVLFKLVREKDVFGAFYKSHLSKRLLGASRSAGGDLEKFMVGRLKHECGSSFTAKMEGMLLDLELAGALNEQFAAFRADASTADGGAVSPRRAGVELSIRALNLAHWPA